MGTYDPMPADGDLGWGPWVRNTVTSLDTRATTLESAGVGGGTTSPRPVFLQVVSKDAPAWEKVGADPNGTLGSYLCDGINDHIQINAAHDRASPLQSRNAAMPATAEQCSLVKLSGGEFICAGTVLTHTAVWTDGCGFGTKLKASGLGAAPLFALSASNDHLVHVSNMWLDGNFAAGGTGNLLDFDMTASGNTSGYPDVNPDADSLIHDLLFTGASNGTSRTLCHVWAASTANNRGTIIDRIQGRSFSGDGISYESASDSYISNTHIGTGGGVGHRVAGGNTKLTNVKSFFCDDTGFVISSSSAIVHGLEAQDNATGVNASGADVTGSAWMIDSCLNDGLIISTAPNLSAVTIKNRAGGRYATQTNGVRLVGTITDGALSGRISPSGITNKFVGTPGARFRTWMPDGTSSNAFN